MGLETNPMVNFFMELGHNIYECGDAWWYEVQPKVIMALPYYKVITPNETELKNLMNKDSLKLVRYPTKLTSYGFVSNITINTNTGIYDMDCLHQKSRNQTRRGLENTKVEKIDFKYLAQYGLVLNISTAKRQGRESYYSDTKYWTKFCTAGEKTDGVDAWGAFVDGKLSAFAIAVATENKWIEWIVNHSLTEVRNKYPNNALVFTMGQHYLNKEKCNGICYGLGSLEDTQYLDHFKMRMGWTIEPIKQRLLLSPKTEFVFSLAKEPFLKLLNGIFKKNFKVRKASAIIRLYNTQTKNIP